MPSVLLCRSAGDENEVVRGYSDERRGFKVSVGFNIPETGPLESRLQEGDRQPISSTLLVALTTSGGSASG